MGPTVEALVGAEEEDAVGFAAQVGFSDHHDNSLPHSLPHRYYHDCTDLLVDYCVVPHHYPGATWRLRSLLDYVFNGFSYITDHILGRRISFLEVNAG